MKRINPYGHRSHFWERKSRSYCLRNPSVTFKVLCCQPSINKDCEPIKVSCGQLLNPDRFVIYSFVAPEEHGAPRVRQIDRSPAVSSRNARPTPFFPCSPRRYCLASCSSPRPRARAHACVAQAQGMRRALRVIAELRRHQFMHRGLKEEKKTD